MDLLVAHVIILVAAAVIAAMVYSLDHQTSRTSNSDDHLVAERSSLFRAL